MCFVLRDRLDQTRLQEALSRVVSKTPELAGRIRSGLRRMWICYSGSVGCRFRVRPLEPAVEDEIEGLSSQKYIGRAISVQELLALRADVGSVGSSEEEIIDKAGPVCVATYCPGSRISVLALSLCHLVGDGWVFFEVLRCWEQEYLGGSSEPLPGRVDTCISDLALLNFVKIVPVVFNYGIWLLRGRPPMSVVMASMSDSQFAEFKAREVEKLSSTDFISQNDAFVAWLANVLSSKFCFSSVHDRGRGSTPSRCTGNCFFVPTCLPANGRSAWSALDVRRVVRDKRSDNDIFTFRRVGGWVRGQDVCVVSSWAKLQFAPSFGSEPLFSCVSCAERFNYFMPVAILHRTAPGEIVVTHSGLKGHQAARLEAAYREVGISSVATLQPEEVASLSEAVRLKRTATPASAGKGEACVECEGASAASLWRSLGVHSLIVGIVVLLYSLGWQWRS